MKKFKTAVILSGGRSSRMGRDKALLDFGGYSSLAEYQYRRLSKLFEKVYISAKEDKFEFDVPLVLDAYPTSSPLVALVSIFEMLNSEEIFVLSVDAPFVTEEIIGRLYEVGDVTKSATVAKGRGGLEPLCSIYRASILPRAKEALEQGNHRLSDLLSHESIESVTIESSNSFMNLNRPSEYEEALKYQYLEHSSSII